MFPGKLGAIKCLFHEYKPQPLHVQWFITGKCNYRCQTCQVWTQPPKAELSTDEIKRGIDILNEMRVVDVVFTGGNPLLRNDIEEILKYTQSKLPLVTIYDNGSMIEKRLSTLRYVDKVCISLSTLNPELQSRISGVPRTLENALNSLELLEKNSISPAVSILITNENLSEAPLIIEYFGSRGMPINLSLYDSLSLPNSSVKIGKEDASFHLSNEKMSEFISALHNFKKKYKIYVDKKTIDCLENLYSENTRNWKCQALSSFFIINEAGYVSGCHIMPPVCHIFDLQNLWETDKFKQLRLQYRKCEKCNYLCYITYSNLKRVRDLFGYALDYIHTYAKSSKNNHK